MTWTFATLHFSLLRHEENPRENDSVNYRLCEATTWFTPFLSQAPLSGYDDGFSESFDLELGDDLLLLDMKIADKAFKVQPITL